MGEIKNNKYYGDINEQTEWDGDASTENYPVAGKSIQKWIKDMLRTKFGYIRKSGTKLHVILELFRDEAAAVEYDGNPEQFAANRQVVEFDVPDAYTRQQIDEALRPLAKKTEIPTKVSQLQNDVGYLTEHQDISGKVDKKEGKQLSTEDFTTLLKEKLESLQNYDDAEIQAAVSRLQTDLATLIGGNPSAAIESFNEIIAFLKNVEDTQTLEGIIAGIEQQISSIIERIHAQDNQINGLKARVPQVYTNYAAIQSAPVDANKIYIDTETMRNYIYKDGTLTLVTSEPEGGYEKRLLINRKLHYNYKTGYYELNGLKNITLPQACDIFDTCIGIRLDDARAYTSTTIRTNLPYQITRMISPISDICTTSYHLEVFSFGETGIFITDDGANAFRKCSKLETILGYMEFKGVVHPSCFADCPSLRNVKIFALKESINLKDCKNLTASDDVNSSIGYLIENLANEKQISIIVHPEVFVKIPQTLIDKALKKQATIQS